MSADQQICKILKSSQQTLKSITIQNMHANFEFDGCSMSQGGIWTELLKCNKLEHLEILNCDNGGLWPWLELVPDFISGLPKIKSFYFSCRNANYIRRQMMQRFFSAVPSRMRSLHSISSVMKRGGLVTSLLNLQKCPLILLFFLIWWNCVSFLTADFLQVTKKLEEL